MTANNCTFTPDSMTLNGIDFPVSYNIPPHGDGSVFVLVQQGEQNIRIRIQPDSPHHAAALAAWFRHAGFGSARHLRAFC